MIEDVSKPLKDRIDELLKYTVENCSDSTIDISSTIYEYKSGQIYASLATYYKINNATFPKRKKEVLLFLDHAFIDYNYKYAFQGKDKMHNFIDDYTPIYNTPNPEIEGTYFMEKPGASPMYQELSEIPLVEAFKNEYLSPFFVFLKNRFIFWSDITYIHSIHGDYLRINDPEMKYCNKDWYPATPTVDHFVERSFPIRDENGKAGYEYKWLPPPNPSVDDDEIHIEIPDEYSVSVLSEIAHKDEYGEVYFEDHEDEVYTINNNDVVLVQLPFNFKYVDDYMDIEYTEYMTTVAKSELIFTHDGFLYTGDKSLISEKCAYISTELEKEWYITSSWSENFSTEKNIKIEDYINQGKKVFFKNLLVFHQTDDGIQLYRGDQMNAEFNSTEELHQRESEGFYYSMISTEEMTYPISMKDEFINKEVAPYDYYRHLSVPLEERYSYSHVAEIIAQFSLSLLKVHNKDIECMEMILHESDLEDNALTISRCQTDAYETFVMLFYDGKLLSNYNTIVYTLDSFTLYFDEDNKEQYLTTDDNDPKIIEVIYFHRVDNTYTIAKDTQLDESRKGYKLEEQTNSDTLILFVDKDTIDYFPNTLRDDRCQYEIFANITDDVETLNIPEYKYTIKDKEYIEEAYTVEKEFKRITLENPNFYNNRVSFASSRQFRYNTVIFANSENEFRFELDSQFKYCRNVDQYMIFYNGELMDQTKYYIVFPDSRTPYNTTSIYMRFICEKDSRLDIFYVPNAMKWTHKEDYTFYKNDNDLYDIIECNTDDTFFHKDLCFIFADGRKIRESRMRDLGRNKIYLQDNITSEDIELCVFRHSSDYNDEYLASLFTNGSYYDELLNDDISNLSKYMASNEDKIMVINNDFIKPDDDMDVKIFDRVIVDYYMQPGALNSNESLPLQIPVYGTIEKTNEVGHIILAPKVNVKKDQ